MPLHNLLVNSSHRLQGTDNDFMIRLPYPITGATEISLESLQMFNTNYTVNNYNNNLPFIAINGSNCVATITPGNYNNVTLCTEIATQMNSIALYNGDVSTYQCGYSNTLGKYYILNSSNNFLLSFATSNNSIATNIGFSNVNKSGQQSYLADFVGCLNSKYYLIHSDIVDGNTTDGEYVKKLVAIVPNNVNFGDMINYNPNMNKALKLSKKDLTTIKFEVKNDKDKAVNFNNVSWSANFVVNKE
jgi:hypothetical protein